MIEVTVKHSGSGVELARIEIENIGGTEELGDYVARFGADRCGAVGVHRRPLYAFPRLRYNALALVLQALNTLDESELELEQETDSSDLARTFRGAGSALQRWTDRLRNH